jgi:hypothetical protein
MARHRPRGTLVDYLVAAIEPALIMIMVGSLMFFLLDLWYSGPFVERLRWILFWFVFGIVLITRVSMQFGTSLAMGYGVALGGAVALVASRLVGFVPPLLVILGIVWWATHKLTFDCTLLDEDQDSGVGLLEETGLDPAGLADAISPAMTTPDDPAAMDASLLPRRPWWKRIGEVGSDPARRPHAPGVWLIYFTLASLPLFGLGQWFVPAVEEERRAWIFIYFLAYISSGMGLLLATSFLNLRRYLRKRKLTMPKAMTATWLSTGAIVIVGLTLVAAVLPLPGTGMSILRGSTTESSDLRASRLAMLKDSGVQGEGAPSEGSAASKAKDAQAAAGKRQGTGQANDPDAAQQTSGKGRHGGKQGPGNAGRGAATGKSAPAKGGAQGKQGSAERDQGDNPAKNQDGSEKTNDQAQDNDQSAKADAKTESGENDSKSADANEHQDENPNAPARLPSAPFQAPSWLRGLVIAAGGAASIFGLYRYGSVVLNALRALLASLFGGLFIAKREKRPKEPAGEPATPPEPRRPFASFANPFDSGLAQRLGPNDLVIYSFEALEAWASEHDLARSPYETPTEFARRLGQARDDLRTGAGRVVGFFVTIVYGQRGFKDEVLPALREFWQALESAPASMTPS